MVNLSELIRKLSEFSRIKYNQNKRIVEIKTELSHCISNLHAVEKEIDKKIVLNNQILDLTEDTQEQINIVVDNKQSTFPWLAKAFADINYLSDAKIAHLLKTKTNPAPKAADEVRKIATEKRRLLQELKQTQYKLEYYEALFPSLTDYVDVPNDEIEITAETDEQKCDEVLLFVSKEEYAQLSASRRNQLALDRYKTRKHSKAHIGKIYERYIGWVYEQKGYTVTYYGIKNGLNDLGRDLICENETEVCVVQCKCWSKEKNIHENAICQLYGTMVKYKIENHRRINSLFGENVKAVFITTTTLSETALEFANALGVECKCVNLSFDYPIIKCNIGKDGERIYHLPFDQQYDSTIIEKHKGEFYTCTVKEAEQKGFRRAKRWEGSNVKR